MSGEHIDLYDGDEPVSLQPVNRETARARVGLHFACCNVYRYIYLQPQQTSLIGHCPKCLRRVKLEISTLGSAERILRVS